VRRSKRLKNLQSARLAIDKEILKNFKEIEKSDNWKYWKQAIKGELASMDKHKV